ncbi:tRNA (adenosine(37)-N6)-dimethylallyltransferase MiaA [Stakelama saccharophila]|uniref:tRNA dimethylallyltransferase n=1 Tax=Stakelama saccharophila TaxID=3075605 RepID=A0ABZ0B5Q4_9SPHN|nr:tRNA (adenosine(37)-N6)-dimethylallyltransferase MiaA [Stakelama sp. W311]WNO52639.1 tRNA (adenosine(37)-N6)-dimethylallyltransferase MiaA [Stakelama sp. W311]
MADSRDYPKVALIAGPTASGKSALAMAIAERHNGIVINADSAQVYRDLRVLSARPSAEQEARVPHRLFGHVDGADPYSAAQWAAEARQAVTEAQASGKLPVLVGGTGMYLRTLIEGIAPVPAIDPGIRAEIRAASVQENYAALDQADPAGARRLVPTDANRIARALEVVRSTGRPLDEWQRQRTGGIGDSVTLLPFILLPDRDWLRERCDRRFEAMLERGAVAEALALDARSDIAADAPVRRAIGVREIVEWQCGTLSRGDAVARAQAATRQYAKRQYTWFRRQPPPFWHRTAGTQTNELLCEFEIKYLLSG